MNYSIIRTNRKTVAIQIKDDCRIIVRAPIKLSDKKIKNIVNQKQEWIDKTILRVKSKPQKLDCDIKKLTEIAKNILPQKIEYYGNLMGIKPNGVKITHAKKRFGSCSYDNRICFSCFLMLYPEKAIDYVVIHELAHIIEHNHSKNFYNIIKRIMPDYKQAAALLR